MAIRHPPALATAGRDDPPAAVGRDDSTEQVLARSRDIREKGNRQIQAAREHVATARRLDPGARSGSDAQNSAAGLNSADEEIERTRQARARLAEVAARLAQTEESVAHIHDEMAGRDSEHAAEYRRAAEDARQAARRAREIQRNTAGPGPW